MKPTMSIIVALLYLQFFAIATINISFCKGSSYVGCIESEKQALLKFKQDLNDPSNRLASWIGDGDCCNWAGVICDNITGHVLKLNLRNSIHVYSYNYIVMSGYGTDMESPLTGKINPSLLDLKHLNYLDLSGNSFLGIQIPGFIGSMGSLRYLNLSRAEFSGMVPHQLGNLSSLQYLDLSQNSYIENFSWLSSLSLLEHLDLSGVDLSKVSDKLVSAVNSLPSLKVLRLADCQIRQFPSLSFANFSSLTTLDLSSNQFDNPLVPSWIFGLSGLVFLDLSYSNFQGPIPDGLGNLTLLRYLDLSENQFNSIIPDWFSRFSSLEYLSLSGTSLQGSISSGLGNLTRIRTLHLSSSGLEGKIPTSFGTLCSLRSVFLSDVKLSQEISEVLDIFSKCVAHQLELLYLRSSHLFGHLTRQIGQFKNLQNLDLSDNSISGVIPSSLGEVSSLIALDISYNKLSGPIPFSVGNVSSLRALALSGNNLVGSIPSSIGEISFLEYLDLSNNKLNGTLSELHFVNLTKLTLFLASGNSLIFKVNPNWVPPFQLQILQLSSCHLGPQFPLWLHSQKHLEDLDISNTGISDFPWKSISQLGSKVNLSHNQIHGEIPDLTGTSEILSLDLSSNNMSGSLPLISFHVSALDLSNNAFSGSIFHFICYGNVSKNIQFLNLAKNVLSGDIPDCWMNWPNLVVLNLGNNNFTGSPPISIGTLVNLQSLNLRTNRLSGIIPVSLQNCTELVALDISKNEFVDNIPIWIGERFSKMMILNLRSNKFHGLLPIELCRLTSLQILDLASNNLSGTIPRCINNFSAMAAIRYSRNNAINYPTNRTNFVEDASLVIKGVLGEYNYILNLVRYVDISKNYFSGQILQEITELGALQSLNFSHNHFVGRIPENIGAMKSLESVDFSNNKLSGGIPSSISSLTFLNHLNLSYNNLTGKIPSSTQLESFSASCFTGNDLCGLPLPRNCTENVYIPERENGEKDDDEDEVNWFYISMTLGFVVGFWCVIGPLFVNRRWRYEYCNFLDGIADKFGSIARKCC